MLKNPILFIFIEENYRYNTKTNFKKYAEFNPMQD